MSNIVKFLFSFVWVLTFLDSREILASQIQAEASLEDPFCLAKHQTGVASIVVLENDDFHYKETRGTGNLIDIQHKNLRGKLVLTVAHVVNYMSGSAGFVGYVRFIDENNNSEKVLISEVFCHPDSSEKFAHDICLIILDKAVNTIKYKPFELDYSESFEDLLGKEVNAYGCSGLFGKLSADVLIEEQINNCLRRGMETRIAGYEQTDKLYCGTVFANVHPYHGYMSIFRSSEPFTEKEKMEILRKKEENVGISERELWIKASEYNEMKRNFFLKKLICKDDFCNEILNLNGDVDDLDKQDLISKWKNYVQNEPYASYDFKLKDYFITFLPPLSKSSGRSYNGDSGGGWTDKTGKIIAMSVAGCRSMKSETLTIFHIDNSGEIIQKTDDSLNEKMNVAFLNNEKGALKTIWLAERFEDNNNPNHTLDANYFSKVEKLISSNRKDGFIKNASPVTYATTLLANKAWIIETLETIYQKYG